MASSALLARERSRGSINVQLLEEIVHGGELLLRKRKKMYHMVSKQLTEITKNHINTLEKPKIYDEGVRRHVIMTKVIHENPEFNNFADRLNIMRLVYQYSFSPFLLHFTMFRDCIDSQSTPEQLATWQHDIDSQKIIGTFVQTELGHGTNLSRLETTAVYDPSREEFILNTPTLTATKFWPGGLAHSSNHAAVMAQCVVGGKSRGLHAFLVPLRHLETHETLPGRELGDIGPKLGWNTVDNGYLKLTDVKIPRTNMLMKHAEVTKEGEYKRHTSSDKSSYLGLINARTLAGQYFAGRMLLMAATVAIRHNVVTMGTITGDEEVPLIALKSHLHTISVSIATGYCFWFAGEKLLQDYLKHYPTIIAGDFSTLPNLHASSSGLKALGSEVAPGMLESLRVCCGFAGGLVGSGLTSVIDSTSAGITIDGENTVLYLQLARYLTKKFVPREPKELKFDVTWCSENVIKTNSDLEFLVQLQKLRNYRAQERVMGRLRGVMEEGVMNVAQAWNSLSVQLVEVAKTHAWTYVIESSKAKVDSIDDVILRSVMANLFRLFVYSAILDSRVDFMRYHLVTSTDLSCIEQKIEELCNVLSPNLVRLTDAFGMSDLELDTLIGAFEGAGTESLLRWAGLESASGSGGGSGRDKEDPPPNSPKSSSEDPPKGAPETVLRRLEELRKVYATPTPSKL